MVAHKIDPTLGAGLERRQMSNFMFLCPFHSTSPSVTAVDGCPLGTDRFPSVVSAL